LIFEICIEFGEFDLISDFNLFILLLGLTQIGFVNLILFIYRKKEKAKW